MTCSEAKTQALDLSLNKVFRSTLSSLSWDHRGDNYSVLCNPFSYRRRVSNCMLQIIVTIWKYHLAGSSTILLKVHRTLYAQLHSTQARISKTTWRLTWYRGYREPRAILSSIISLIRHGVWLSLISEPTTMRTFSLSLNAPRYALNETTRISIECLCKESCLNR